MFRLLACLSLVSYLLVGVVAFPGMRFDEPVSAGRSLSRSLLLFCFSSGSGRRSSRNIGIAVDHLSGCYITKHALTRSRFLLLSRPLAQNLQDQLERRSFVKVHTANKRQSNPFLNLPTLTIPGLLAPVRPLHELASSLLSSSSSSR